ncbi:hypothetical protein C8F04DRAFT_947173, partial [Mycena alexandri]
IAEMAHDYHESAQDVNRPDSYAKLLATSMVLEDCQVHVSESQHAKLDEELGVEDVKAALNVSKNGSSPGIDSLAYKFYRWLRILFDEDTQRECEGFDILWLLAALFSDIERHGVQKGTHGNEGWMCPIQ